MIFRLDKRLLFPDVALAEEDGLLAVGGDLSTGRLLLAYQNGIFPWYNDDTPILWYSPHERFVLFPDELKISKSMRQILRSDKFTITCNQCFEKVIEACSAIKREGQDGTWITNDMQNAYIRLHHEGHAHSIEVWEQGQLVGGLYGVQIGSVFCGESMFSLTSNASKVSLINLCNSGDYTLIDCQVHTEHLESLGARMVRRKEYMDMLQNNVPKS
jgi:leucyl/phenylalanyl-tRNA--protein transferase